MYIYVYVSISTLYMYFLDTWIILWVLGSGFQSSTVQQVLLTAESSLWPSNVPVPYVVLRSLADESTHAVGIMHLRIAMHSAQRKTAKSFQHCESLSFLRSKKEKKPQLYGF